jgi:hypothetical protein
MFATARVGTHILMLLAAVAGAPAGLAQAPGVDCKFYGFVTIPGARQEDAPVGEVECFYDAKGIVPAPGGHLRVRTR